MQQIGQQTGQYSKRLGGATGKGFRPGRSGNPGGAAISRKLLDAKIAELTSAWPGDCPPNAVEQALLRQLANVLFRRPTLDTARLASRLAAQLGYSAALAERPPKPCRLDAHLAALAASSAPDARTGTAILAERSEVKP